MIDDPNDRKKWNEAFELVYKRGIVNGLKQAAEIADAFADENFSMAHDTIMLDPVIGRRGETLTKADFEKSESLIIDGCVHSSMAHAAQNIAEAIRSKATELAS
ncbi:hypothetical protein EGT36_21400 [Agrobacterium sp. FDAARGOS_525]|uniref:hypothetical protein n=1 Tax=Agrobacterium sp. FDAARGOS_525 TaxID=2420311 RepID=UPI000F666A26|nr:hypothetical protein [Agrobacterium sp. FDAARGOS_525]RSC31231.1 hypothetical protein EGT36_21400 [Agrobacterium sp. FDAARGOS_525]